MYLPLLGILQYFKIVIENTNNKQRAFADLASLTKNKT